MSLSKYYIENNWYYLNVQMTLAKWYSSAGQKDKTSALHTQLIRHEPGFTWILKE